MVGTICHQLTKDVDLRTAQAEGFDVYYTDHGFGVYPAAASGMPFNATCLAVKDDPVADLVEDMAAEEKARATYEKLINLCSDAPDVVDALRFLRQREVVHFQRFGECLRSVQEKLAMKKHYFQENPCANVGCDNFK